MAIRQYENFIDGRWTSDNASALIDVIDPATEEVVGRVLDGGAKHAVMAIEAARRAFDEGPWPWMSVRERAKVLKRFSEIMESRHDELRELIVSEIGSVHFLTDFYRSVELSKHRTITAISSSMMSPGSKLRERRWCHRPDLAALSSFENPSEWSA